MRTSLPPVKLELHPSMFDQLMAVLEKNAHYSPQESVRDHAERLMKTRMRYTRMYENEYGPYASLLMYEKEASEMILQLLIASIGNVEVTKEYSKDLMGGDTDVPPGRDEGSV